MQTSPRRRRFTVELVLDSKGTNLLLGYMQALVASCKICTKGRRSSLGERKFSIKMASRKKFGEGKRNVMEEEQIRKIAE